MKKLIVLCGIFAYTFAFAETQTTTPTISERLTCSEIQAQISELSSISEPDTETINKLTALKATHRRTCTISAGSRRNSATSRVITSATETETEPETEPETETEIPETTETGTEPETQTLEPSATETQTPEPSATETETVILAESELTPEQALANLDSGLCADGSEPNKFGCCGDELFKDLGDTIFACCPPDGGDCFPPIN